MGSACGAGVLAQLGGDGVCLKELVPKLLGDGGVSKVGGMCIGVGTFQAEVGAGEACLGGVEASDEGAEPLLEKWDVYGVLGSWGGLGRRVGAAGATLPCAVGARSTSSAIRAEGTPGIAGGGGGRAVAVRSGGAGQEGDEGGVLLGQGLDREDKAVGAVLVVNEKAWVAPTEPTSGVAVGGPGVGARALVGHGGSELSAGERGRLREAGPNRGEYVCVGATGSQPLPNSPQNLLSRAA